MHTYNEALFNKQSPVVLTAIQIQTDDAWDKTPATYHLLARDMAGMFAKFTANAIGKQVRMSFPPNETVDPCRCSGSYIWPDQIPTLQR
jgi:hypothetical protein